MIHEIAHFDEYNGSTEAGGFDNPPKGPDVDALLDEANHQIGELNDELREVKSNPDWLDNHLEIVGVSPETAERLKDRIRGDVRIPKAGQ